MMLVTETKNFSDFPVGLSGDISDHDNVTGTRQAGTERVPARSVYLQEELTVDLNDLKYQVLTPHFPIITGVYEDSEFSYQGGTHLRRQIWRQTSNLDMVYCHSKSENLSYDD